MPVNPLSPEMMRSVTDSYMALAGLRLRGYDSAPAESGGDVGQDGLYDMRIVGNTQLVRHS